MELFWSVFLYSMLGYGLETGYAWLKSGSPRGRRMLLLLPMCPVYGLGAAAILALPSWVTASPLRLFLLGGITAGIVEYGMGYFYERVCGVRFWDYHGYAFQLHGKVCLRFTVYWGVLSLLLVYGVHPVIRAVVLLLPRQAAAPLVGLFLMDLIYTSVLLRHTRDRSILSFGSLGRLSWLESPD